VRRRVRYVAEERADAGHPAYGPHALRTDLDRCTFLLSGTDGEDLFGRY
jgi:hypothetical protein